jgi:Ca2+-binding RTX toxin-like protein
MATVTYHSNEFETTSQSPTPPGTVKIEQDSFIVTAAGEAFKFEPGAWTVNVDGFVSGQTTGMDFRSDMVALGKSKLTIGTEGTVESHGTSAMVTEWGIKTAQALDVINSGRIAGHDFGFQSIAPATASTSKGFTITNNKSSEILSNGIAIDNENDAWALTVKNQGAIEGGAHAIQFRGGLNLTNSGFILGDVFAASTVTETATITNSGKMNTIDLWHGDDTIKNTGIIDGNVKLYGGHNSLTNSNIITGNITCENGDDTMANTGALSGLVNLGGGNNTLNNGGSIDALVVLGNGNDTITLTTKGSIGSTVSLGDGLNKLTNGGFIDGNVVGGTGVDVVKNTGTILGTIDLGGDNDSFTGGNAAETVQDNDGDDSTKLGGGNDFYLAFGKGNDTVDGGAGNDTFDASGTATEGYRINLDSKTVTLAVTMKGNTAFTDTTVAGGSLKGFETVRGTDKSDYINGGAAAETIDGHNGVDRIAGGGGADILSGGVGVDFFWYHSIKDSGTTKATRDTIADFDTTDDIIYLHEIDANTKLAGDDEFNFIGNDKAFVNAGDLRAVHEGGHTIIQGDVNGDHKADFSIDLVGTFTMAADDFNG